MNKFILLLLFSHVSYTFAETSTITTEAYTADGVPSSGNAGDLTCPGSLKRQSFQGNTNYVCRLNGVAQPEASHHSHVVNAFTEFRTQMVDFDTNNAPVGDQKYAIAPNRKEDKCIKLSDRTFIDGPNACPEDANDVADDGISLTAGATGVECTRDRCLLFISSTGVAMTEYKGGRDGILLSDSRNIHQGSFSGDTWVRSSPDLDEYFRKRFLKTKVTLSVNTAQGETQVYEGCDVQLDGTSLGDLKDYIEFIPNHRALGTCEEGGSEKMLSECGTDLYVISSQQRAKFRPKARDPDCASETGKCDKSRRGAAEFRKEGLCNIAIGTQITYGSSFCEVTDGQGDVTRGAQTQSECTGTGKQWILAQERLGYIQNECGTCRDPGNNNKDVTAKYTRKEDCIGSNDWTSVAWTANDDYSCVFYLANNMFIGETSVIASFHKVPSTVGSGKAIHSVSVPVGFSPHSLDKNFNEAKALKIIDSELQNKYFRDVAIGYQDHCEHSGNYIAPSMGSGATWTTSSADNCKAPHSFYDCNPGSDGGGGCTYSEAGTVNARLTATFVDTRYKVAAQNGVERMKQDIGDMLILKSGLELHQDYRSFNDPTTNNFVKGNDGTIVMTPIKYDYKKVQTQWGGVASSYANVGNDLVGRCLGYQYGADAILYQEYCKDTATGNRVTTNCGANNDEDCTEANCDTTNAVNYQWITCACGGPKSTCPANPAGTWDEGYPGLQQAVPATGEGSLEDAYKCDTGTVDEPIDLRDSSRGNCYSQYAMLYTFSFSYGGLPHFKPSYIGCPLCANELIIKAFKEDTDDNGVADTYQVNTKIPVDLSSTGLEANAEATNEIILPGLDLLQASAAALLEPEMLQKFSFVFDVQADQNNDLRTDAFISNGFQKKRPMTLDDELLLHNMFTPGSFSKVVPYVIDQKNQYCGYNSGVCKDGSGDRVFGENTEEDCLEDGTCNDNTITVKAECTGTYDDDSDADTAEVARAWTSTNTWDTTAGAVRCMNSKSGDSGYSALGSDKVRCDVGRNLCTRENEIKDPDTPLNVFVYETGPDGAKETHYGCPPLYDCLYANGDDSDGADCSGANNLKLFRLSSDPAASLRELFDTTCKIYIPSNGYGSTYEVAFVNADEVANGRCRLELDNGSFLDVENVHASKCAAGQYNLFSSLKPAGTSFKTTVVPVHTPYNYPDDQEVTSTIKELKSGRFLRLEQTKLNFNQRLEITSVFQRVATTVTFKISKNTVNHPNERTIFKIRGGSATIDGFTASNPSTQLSDECALGPKGQCKKPDANSFGAEFLHKCGKCVRSSTATGTDKDKYKTKLQCELRGYYWLAGEFNANQANVASGYAWKQHTIREYDCDDAYRNYDDSAQWPLFPCRIANGTCTNGNKPLSAKSTCENQDNFKIEEGSLTGDLPVGVWHGAIVGDGSEESPTVGTCLMSYESCVRGNAGEWQIQSTPRIEFKENIRATLNTECQPDTLTTGAALQNEVLFITASTNGESIEHSIRTTKECTGTVDLQFEDQTLGQEFAIYTTRVPCSRVSSSELKDQVDLKYDWKTSLDIAKDTIEIVARYSPVVDTAGECQVGSGPNEGDTLLVSDDGVQCDSETKCESTTAGCAKDNEHAKWHNTYEVDTYFGECKQDNTINKTPFEGTPAANVVLNKAACNDGTTGYAFTQVTGQAQRKLERTESSKGGLKLLIDCARTQYVDITCCRGCKCEAQDGTMQNAAALQSQKACEAAGHTWTQGTVIDVGYPNPAGDEVCGICQNTAYTSKSTCTDASNAGGASTWTGPRSATANTDSEYVITAGYMVPSVNTLAESYVITYSLAMSYVRRIHDNAFGSDNSIYDNGKSGADKAGQITYCDDQLFTASIRRDATASVTVAQVKAAELNRAVVVEDIRWIGSPDGAVGGCNVGEFRIEVTFAVMDQDARYQDLAYSGSNGALSYWEPSLLSVAMIDTAADAQNPNSMIIKGVVDGATTATILRKPGLRCLLDSDGSIDTSYVDNPNVADLCETETCQQSCSQANDRTLSETDFPAITGDQSHFKVLGQCVAITQCLTNAGDEESPVEENDDGVNGNSWADYSVEYKFDLVVRGEFLKSDVDTKIEVTSNFQECPVTAEASVTGVPRIGAQLECFEPVSFTASAAQWLTQAADPENDATYTATITQQQCMECHRLPISYLEIKRETDTALDHGDNDLYLLSANTPATGLCTDGVSTTEADCEDVNNEECGALGCKWIEAGLGSAKSHACCPMDCGAAYADDLAQTNVLKFVTDTDTDALTKSAYDIATTQGWQIESSEIFIERYDTSTITSTTGATLIGEVRLCICPDPADSNNCKIDNNSPYGLSSFNQHSTVSKHCQSSTGQRLYQHVTQAACTAADASNVWQDGIEEYFMICGDHTDVTKSSDNYGKEAGINNIYDQSDSSKDLSTGADKGKLQINLMPLSEAPADEFRIRYDVILKTTQFNQRRRLRTSTVVRPGKAPKLGDIKLGSSAETKGINILFRPANGVAPKQPSDSGKEESPKHDADKSEPMEAGTVFLIVAAGVIGVGLMIWGSSLFMNKGEAGTVEETTALVSQVVQNVVRKPRFENLRY